MCKTQNCSINQAASLFGDPSAPLSTLSTVSTVNSQPLNCRTSDRSRMRRNNVAEMQKFNLLDTWTLSRQSRLPQLQYPRSVLARFGGQEGGNSGALEDAADRK